MDDYDPPERVFGVDFSADRERAGEKILIAEARVDDGLRVVDCSRVPDRLDAGRRRESAIPALTRFLGGLDGDAAAGLDFPFSLPADVVAVDDWTEFLRRFPAWADDPEDMARTSEARASLNGDDGHPMRATEEPLGAMSPCNLRLRAGTFYGIRDVLRPLVLSGRVRVPPMQSPSSDHPSLLEVYPAGTLDDLDGHRTRYKASGEEPRERRAANLDLLVGDGVEVTEEVRERVLADEDGDALDAVIAAFAAAQNAVDPSNLRIDDGRRLLEGHIYV